jgi:hypothetical protein
LEISIFPGKSHPASENAIPGLCIIAGLMPIFASHPGFSSVVPIFGPLAIRLRVSEKQNEKRELIELFNAEGLR